MVIGANVWLFIIYSWSISFSSLNVNIITDPQHRTKLKWIDWFGDGNLVNSNNFNAKILKFY